MGKYKTLFIGFVLGIAATVAIQYSSAIAPTEAHADPLPAAPGRYQLSTVLEPEYSVVFGTVFDTQTGEMVRTWKYKGLKSVWLDGNPIPQR